MKPNRFAWSGDDVLGLKIVNEPSPEHPQKDEEEGDDGSKHGEPTPTSVGSTGDRSIPGGRPRVSASPRP